MTAIDFLVVNTELDSWVVSFVESGERETDVETRSIAVLRSSGAAVDEASEDATSVVDADDGP